MKKFLDRQFKRIIRLLAIALISGLAIVILTIAPENRPEASDRIKGVWLTHVGNAFLTYTTLTDNVFYQLASLNYNRVYVDVYNNGTTYSSKYAPRNYLLSLPFTNPLKTAIATGKRHGLKVYAWYEHGMMTFGNAELAKLHPDWISDFRFQISDFRFQLEHLKQKTIIFIDKLTFSIKNFDN